MLLLVSENATDCWWCTLQYYHSECVSTVNSCKILPHPLNWLIFRFEANLDKKVILYSWKKNFQYVSKHLFLTGGAGVLTQAEHVERGTLHPETFSSYMKAAGGVFVVMLVVGIIVLNVGVTAFSSWWLALWIKAGSGVSRYWFGCYLTLSILALVPSGCYTYYSLYDSEYFFLTKWWNYVGQNNF